MRGARSIAGISIGVVYVMLCVLALYPPVVHRAVAEFPPVITPALESLMSVVVPPVLFVWGADAWPTVLITMSMSAAFFSLWWRSRHRTPQVATVWIWAAASMWVGTAWIAVASGV